MAQPARQARRPRPVETPVDPTAIDRAYHVHRARRRAKVERKRESRRANLRYFVVFLFLLVALVVLSLTVWRQVQQLFGL
jgi:hypothetical protein